MYRTVLRCANYTSENSYLSNTGSVVAVSSDAYLPSDVIFAFGSSFDEFLCLDNFTTSIQNFSSSCDGFFGVVVASTQRNVPLGKLWVCRDLLTFNIEEASNDFVLPDECNLTSLKKNASSWTINGFPISYCLADQQPSRCTVQSSSTILIVVILSNIVEVLCMLYAIARVKHKAMITVDDAVVSFLATDCSTTSKMCLWSKRDVQSGP